MGDGLVKKYAVILNGDVETRHTENVERAIRTLRREGEYDISVLSTQAPKARADRYVAAEEAKLEELISGLKAKMDDDDLLVVYVTGHGQAEDEGCIALPRKGCLPFHKLQQGLEQLAYGRRIVVMDNCFSGNGLRLFANSKTSIVTQGSPGETVSCQTFSPFFWSDDVKDADGDGKISVQERYAFALEQGKTASLTQFYGPEPVGFSGAIAARPFKTKDDKPIEVHSGAELETQLKRLKPGQLALVDFGADWCVPCAAYRPTFEKVSRESAGRFLMIHAQGIKGSEDDWLRYGIKEFPTVALIDSNGKITPVSQIEDPLDSLLFAALHSPVDQLQLLNSRLKSSDTKERQRGLKGLQALGLKAAPALPEVMKLLHDSQEEIRFEACRALASLGPAAAAAVPELIKMLENDRPPPRIAAAEALAAIGPGAQPAIPALLRAIRLPALAEAEAWEKERGASVDLAKFNAVEWTFELSRLAALALSAIDPGNPVIQKKLLAIAEDSTLSSESRIAALLGLEKFVPDSSELTPTLANLWDSIRALRNAEPSAPPLRNTASAPKPKRIPYNRASVSGSFFVREGAFGGAVDLGFGRQIPNGPELRLRLGAAGAAALTVAQKSDLELRASFGGAWAFGEEDADVRPAILLPEVGVSHRIDAKKTAFRGSPLGMALQVKIGEAWRFEAGARATMDYAEDLELGGESSLSFIRKF